MPPAARRRRRRLRDPRLWVGVVITAATLTLAARGVDFRTLLNDLSRANLPLLIGLSVPIYVLTLWVRALRWRHLTNAVCATSRGALFRATAVGALGMKTVAARIPNATLVTFEDLGHSPQIQAPERFHEALIKGLAKK